MFTWRTCLYPTQRSQKDRQCSRSEKCRITWRRTSGSPRDCLAQNSLWLKWTDFSESKRLVDMPKESSCLRVPRKYGQEVIVLADRIGLRDKELEVQTNADSIFVPILRQ